ncbi:MAG: hypothetical protein U0573_06080 [Phycisphaerales bacterium]|nr:hypothetical protein [Planctomycetota bacterium]
MQKYKYVAAASAMSLFALAGGAAPRPITGGSATLTFDLSALLGQTPLNGFNAVFGITETRNELLSLPGNNPGAAVTWAVNPVGIASPTGRQVQGSTLLVDSSDVLGNWAAGNDFGPFLPGGDQIGFGGMTRFTLDPGISGILLFGDWAIRYAPGRAGGARSGLVLTSNIDFPNAVFADIANASIAVSGNALHITGDVLISDGLIALGFPEGNFGLDIGDLALDATLPSECRGDLNGDGLVDDADFVIFAAAYNLLDCADVLMPAGCPADLNFDGVVDDSDFVIFAAAYNELVCP